MGSLLLGMAGGAQNENLLSGQQKPAAPTIPPRVLKTSSLDTHHAGGVWLLPR